MGHLCWAGLHIWPVVISGWFFDNEDQVHAGVIAAKLDYLEAHFMQRTGASR